MSSNSSKRRNVGNACVACRESKIRCDGIRPVCGSCSRKEKDCHYGTKDDKRRVSLRTAIDILSARVTILTQSLTQHGIPVPPMDFQQETVLNDICERLQVSLVTSSDPESPKDPPNLDVTAPVIPSDDITGWQGSELGNTSSIPPVPFQHQANLPPIQDTTTTTDNGQNALSTISDSYQTDASPVDWPWHIFESNAFLLSDPLLFDNLDIDNNATLHRNGELSAIAPSSQIQFANQNNNGASSDEEQDSELVHQVSTRFGALRISSDGQLRYYGAATNYHLLEGSRHDESVDNVAARQESFERLEQAGLNQDVPPDIEEHLIELYFAWHNPSHLTVDREKFLAARANRNRSLVDTGYYTDVLINAICAIGAAYETRYHPAFVTYPRSLAEFFASRAQILLDADLECPTTATVQALCLLCSYEASRGRDARTWLYGGMAMRLCFDLGLHINCAPYVKAGMLSPQDNKARLSTFWSCLVINHLSSFHFGRPFRIDSEEITAPLPYMNETGQGIRPATDAEMSMQGTGMKVLKEWVYLCEILSPLMRQLYGSASTPINALQQHSHMVTQQLDNWYKALSPDLQVHSQSQPSSEILFLHMGYHHFQILIHRPWTSHRSQPRSGQSAGHRHARRVCITSASAISTLLTQYETAYGFRHMHNYNVNIIFSAALISMFNVIAAGNTTQPASFQATANLSIFFRALDDLSRSFESARRAREHLATIQRKWYLVGASPATGSKRPYNPVQGAHSQKRWRSERAFAQSDQVLPQSRGILHT